MTALVYGAGGHGRVVADVAASLGIRVVAFVDDAPSVHASMVGGLPVLNWDGVIAQQARWDTATFGLGIGSGRARAAILDKILDAGWTASTLVHTKAIVARSAELGLGTVVMAAAVVNPDATLDKGCIVNTGAIVEHDARIGAFVLLGPNSTLGGGVQVGDYSLIGVGASVRPGVRIGSGVTVGVGAAVIDDVPDGMVIAGVPARPVRSRGSVGGDRVGET